MSQRNKTKLPPLDYFYYHGELHRKIRINRGADLIIAWSYPQGRVVKRVYSDVRRNGEKAFSTAQVGKMVQRASRVVRRAIHEGNIAAPQSGYDWETGSTVGYGYWWSEKDIMDLHDYIITVHKGRPRKDGLVVPMDTPSKAELRAIIRQGTVFYVQDEDGEFRPSFHAEKF